MPLTDQALESPPPPQGRDGKFRKRDDTELRNRIGTAPLEAEIERLAREGSSKHAVGLWLRGLREQNRFLVRDYILRPRARIRNRTIIRVAAAIS